MGRSLRSALASRLVQVAFFALVLLLWYLATVEWGVSRILLPRPDAVLRELADVLRTGEFAADLRVTLYEIAVAFVFSAVGGTLTGYAISRSPYLIAVFNPLISGIYAVPAILFFPLYVLIFGLGPLSKIAMGTTIAFFPVALSTIAGFAHVEPTLVVAARSMGAGGYKMFRWVLLPAAFPVILTGLRMGFILAMLSILGSETISSLSGLGHRIVQLSESMHMPRMFAYIAFVVTIALALNTAVGWLERRAKREY